MHTSRAPNLLLKIFPPQLVAKVAGCQEMDIFHQDFNALEGLSHYFTRLL